MSNLSLSSFYHYVFGDLATVTINKRVPESKRAKVKESKENQKKRVFSHITKDAQRSDKFRAALQGIASQTEPAIEGRQNGRALEALLYGNKPGSSISNTYYFPNNKKILSEFAKLNKQYGYFKVISPKQKASFLKLFKACKLMADFDECNNTENDSLAYLHAYKILVWFGEDTSKHGNSFSAFEKYLKQHDLIGKHIPADTKVIHDALAGVLSVVPEGKSAPDLKVWQALIKTHGSEVIQFFQRAVAIEQRLKRAPQDLREAVQVLAKLTYKRAVEYPELAYWCKKYSVSEEVFNRCLVFRKYLKTSDTLPDITIDGTSLGHPDYYLTKLPIDDPRAYILGAVTKCCQSIGGDSEKCVIDGLARANNGFYVLLKRRQDSKKQKGKQPPPKTSDGKINNDHYDIVGQAYGWRSNLGNLVIDSWENRKTKYDTCAVSLLKEFGQQVVKCDDKAVRVTIGSGGKTPAALKQGSKVSNPSLMAEGYQYHDSKQQHVIAFHQKKLLKAAKANGLAEHHQKTLQDHPDCVYSLPQLETVIWFCKVYPAESKVSEAIFKYSPVAVQLHQANILLPANLTKITNNYYIRGNEIYLALSELHKYNPKLCTQDNFNAVISNGRYIWRITLALIELDKAGLLKPKNRQNIMDKAEHAQNIARALIELDKAGLLKPKNRQNIMDKAEHAQNIARCLIELHKAGLLNSNPQNRKNIMSSKVEHISGIVMALSTLNKSNIVLTQDIFNDIINKAQYVVYIGRAVSFLEDAKILLTHDVFNAIMKDPIGSYCAIGDLDVKMILEHPQNLQAIRSKPEHILDIARTLEILYYNDISFTQNIFNVIIDKSEHARDIAQALIDLNDAKLLTPPNRQAIVAVCQASTKETIVKNIQDKVQELITCNKEKSSLSTLSVFNRPPAPKSEQTGDQRVVPAP